MYKVSNYSNKVKNINTGIIFEMNDFLPEFIEFYNWKLQGNQPEYIDYFDGEKAEENTKRAIEIDLEYTKLISNLMIKHNDKYIEGMINGTPYVIPPDVLIEKQRLKDECNSKISQLGIADFTYRQNNLILKKNI